MSADRLEHRACSALGSAHQVVAATATGQPGALTDSRRFRAFWSSVISLPDRSKRLRWIHTDGSAGIHIGRGSASMLQ